MRPSSYEWLEQKQTSSSLADFPTELPLLPTPFHKEMVTWQQQLSAEMSR